jgi:hypothetical protein
MKLLVLYQARDSVKDHPGYHHGFCRLVAGGALESHRAIPYYSVSEKQGWNDLWHLANQGIAAAYGRGGLVYEDRRCRAYASKSASALPARINGIMCGW